MNLLIGGRGAGVVATLNMPEAESYLQGDFLSALSLVMMRPTSSHNFHHVPIIYSHGQHRARHKRHTHRLPWWSRELESACQFRGTSLVVQMVKHLSIMRETWIWYLGREDPLEKEMQPTPVLLPGKPHGRRSLVGYSPWGHKQSDTTERLPFADVGYRVLIPGPGRFQVPRSN